LTDPSVSTDGIKENLLNEAVDFVSELPQLYSDDLDRKAIWGRIGNGLLASATKANGDISLFVNNVLSYIKADPSRVATSDHMANLIGTFGTRDKAWKDAFIRQFQDYHYLIVVKSRAIWQSKKGGK
jgi:hypothetical protein